MLGERLGFKLIFPLLLQQAAAFRIESGPILKRPLSPLMASGVGGPSKPSLLCIPNSKIYSTCRLCPKPPRTNGSSPRTQHSRLQARLSMARPRLWLQTQLPVSSVTGALSLCSLDHRCRGLLGHLAFLWQELQIQGSVVFSRFSSFICTLRASLLQVLL